MGPGWAAAVAAALVASWAAPAPTVLPGAAGGAGSRGPFTAVTFNAGLATGILPLARERVALVTAALIRQPAELLCAQELWQEEHWRGVASALAPRLPHALRGRPDPAAAGGTCAAADIAPLEACHRASCAAARPAELASCMIGRCAHVAMGMDPGCVTCLLREPWSSITAVRQACGEGTASAPQRPLLPARPGGAGAPAAWAFGGSTGIGILSSVPLAETDELPLPSTWSRRSVLYARLASTSIGPLHVFCTHLSAHLGSVPLPGGKSWQREQAEQIGQLLSFVDRKTSHDGAPVLLLGDLNNGPTIPGRVSGKLPAHHARLIDAGFDNPYARQDDARCTYCLDNPLVGRTAGGYLIDHALVRRWGGRVVGQRVLDRPSVLTVEGHRRTTTPSDHYGLSVVLSR